MPSNTRSSKATAASDVVLLTDADVRAINRTTKKDRKQKPARKENNPPPVNTGEIIEISSDEEEPTPRNPVAATAKLQARIQQLEKVRHLTGSFPGFLRILPQENARIKKENDEIKKQQIAVSPT